MNSSHLWIVLASLVIGGLCRLTKDDNSFPITVSPRLRPLLAGALGLAAGVVHQIATGTDLSLDAWLTALAQGLAAGGGAVLGHEMMIESLLGGKEIPVPGLMKAKRKAHEIAIAIKREEP